jgi:hypothetical protein
LLLQFPAASRLAVPDYKAFPTQSRQPGVVFLVSFLVIGQLRRPIHSVRPWRPAVNAASVLVPKTAVDKNDFSPGWKNEVRTAGQVSAV